MFIKKTILAALAIGATIVNPTNAADANAAHTRGLRAESLESRDVPAVANASAHVSIDDIVAYKESLLPTNLNNHGDGDDSMHAKSLESMANTTSVVDDDILSRIDPAFVDEVIMFTQSASPTHDSMHGCVKAKDDLELSVYISSSDDGQVRLCPGIVDFYNEIELSDKSITISCAGPKGSCIFDGNGRTRHFVILQAGVTFSFVDLALVNGLADDDSSFSAIGGSVLFAFVSTIIFDGCLFYNNRVVTSSSFAVGGAIFLQDLKAVINNCLFLNNVAETTAPGQQGAGGAIYHATGNGGEDELKVFDSIFKNNTALSVDTSILSGGGAIYAGINSGQQDVLVLSSVFELNEASNNGGAALFFSTVLNVDWYNNKDLLLGNDAGVNCDGVAVEGQPCFNVSDNFSV